MQKRSLARQVAVLAVGVCLTALIVLAGCMSAREKGRSAGAPPDAEMVMSADKSLSVDESYDAAGPAGGVGGVGGPGAEGSAQAPVPAAIANRKLIRTGQIRVEVEDTEAAMRRIREISAKAGGFIGDTSLTRHDDGSHWGNVTIRVPTDQFDTMLQGLQELGRVHEISTDTQDVTEQYVDLEARIRNRKREEEALLELMKRRGSLEDIIRVEARLSEVRETIERFEGQLRLLKDQVALSTITVSLFEKGEAALAETQEYDAGFHLRSAVRALIGILRGIGTAVIYLVIVGWVFWVPLALIIWAVRRRRASRRAKETRSE
ncbi:MAG: DUF4349 domain-containing protein [Armatimonadetes bacterium]|nr:DUF4349 domain-containing protein [Armatimonadota bacterium]